MKTTKNALQFEVTSETPQPSVSDKYREIYAQLSKIPAGKFLKVTALDKAEAYSAAGAIKNFCDRHGLSSVKATCRGKVVWISNGAK